MKILIAKFVLEANENIPRRCRLEDFDLRFGSECTARMQLGDVFSRADVTLVPAVYADAASNGVLERPAFDYIEGRILNAIKENLRDLDAIYLHLHGASEVEGLGSGDHHILKMVRRLVGPYLPIAVVCDPHGNLSQEYVEGCTLLRSYRESPHTDIEATIRFVCEALLDLLAHRQAIRPCYRKLPLILGGEQSVSADEPVRSINRYMDEMEKDPRILSASWHVGYIRHDCDVAGAGVVVIPKTGADQAYAEQKADELAAFVWERRHEFHYTGLTLEPDEALARALACPEKPVFLTDSGDNVTSGAMGANTWVLRQALAVKGLKKRILFAAIQDGDAYARLCRCRVGDTVSLAVGMGFDELSQSTPLTVTVRHIGRQQGTRLFGESGDFGGCVTASVEGAPVDLILCDSNHPFVERHQVLAAGVDWDDYDVVVVKIGYAFPELKQHGKLCIMSLTGGATLQDTARLPFKRILRPIFPIDDI